MLALSKNDFGLRAKYRVLVVEDSCLLAESAKDALMAAGYAVVGTAATCDDAISLAREHRPDLVLMDIELGGERDGIDAAREIARRLGIPSLFLSGTTSLATRARAGVVSNLGFLNKPTPDEALIAAIDAVRTQATMRGALPCELTLERARRH